MTSSASPSVATLVASAENTADTEITTDEQLLPKITQLKHAVSTNTTQRALHPNSPALFLQSELSLHQAIRALAPVAVHPSLYHSLVQHGLLHLIAELLIHPNHDIVSCVISFTHDLVSADIYSTTSTQSYSTLYQALVQNGVVTALATTLRQTLLPLLSIADTDETQTAQEAVAHVFSIYDNILDLRPDLAQPIVNCSCILDLCISQLDAVIPESAIELLSLLLQDSVQCKHAFIQKDGMPALLQPLSNFLNTSRSVKLSTNPTTASTKRTAAAHSNPEQTEMVQDMLALLCSSLLAGEVAKLAFVQSQGIQLMIAYIKSSTDHRLAATKVLDFACTAYGPAVTKLLESGGLGVVCAVLNGIGEEIHPRNGKKRKRQPSEQQVKTLTEHVFGILFCIFRYADESGRNRLLAKFWENDGVKTRKVLLLYRHFGKSVEEVTAEEGRYVLRQDGTRLSKPADDSDERLIERLEAGLFIVQQGAAIVGTILCNSDPVFQQAVARFLPQVGLNCDILADAIREYAASIDEGTNEETKQQTETERKRLTSLADQLSDLPLS